MKLLIPYAPCSWCGKQTNYSWWIFGHLCEPCVNEKKYEIIQERDKKLEELK